ncbi:MAG: acyl-CoA dehydrogenase family protein, partial [Prolixibacteraceae bacterium]|nr:acyl-CoA dehydrogenase family protein [Prolixibacteraceae bacterium]
FAENEIKPVILGFDEKEEFPVSLIEELGKTGVFGMNAPQKFGGMGADTLSYIIAVEELARVDGSVGATLAAHNSLGVGPIVEFGTEKQKQKYLPELCTGKALWAFGLTEKNAGSDAQAVETKADLKKGSWHITGSKLFITNGSSEISKGHTVAAITGKRPDGRKEISAILVENDLPGVTARTMRGKLVWRAANNADIAYKNVVVQEENLLGERGKGIHIMLKTIDNGRLSIAALGLGCAQGAYEMATEYAMKRKQFGKPISEFQAISFKLADMAMKVENARNTLYNACWLKDNGYEFGKQSAMAKLYCSEIAREVTDEAIQVFGGAGLLRENHVERFYRDQRLLQIGEGTSEILRMVISRKILKEFDQNSTD